MKNKKLIITVACICVISFILGITGIVKINRNAEIEKESTDKPYLVGMYVTTEPVDGYVDKGGYWSSTSFQSNGTDTFTGKNRNGNKIYAKRVTKTDVEESTGEEIITDEYVFEGIEGYGLYAFKVKNPEIQEEEYTSLSFNSGFCDVTLFSYAVGELSDYPGSDDLENLTEATMYITKKDVTIYKNPVFQEPDGDVFLVPADMGEYIGGSILGEKITLTTEDVEKKVQNTGITRVFTTKVVLNIVTAAEMKEIRIAEYDVSDKIIASKTYNPSELPDDINVQKDTEYLMVEEVMERDGKEIVNRKIVDKDDYDFITYETDKNGIYIERCPSVNW